MIKYDDYKELYLFLSSPNFKENGILVIGGFLLVTSLFAALYVKNRQSLFRYPYGAVFVALFSILGLFSPFLLFYFYLMHFLPSMIFTILCSITFALWSLNFIEKATEKEEEGEHPVTLTYTGNAQKHLPNS